MPESAPRNTSESTSEIPVIAAAPAALQLEQLDQVVGYDAHITEQFEYETDQTNYDAYREHKIDELLAENGIIDGDDEQVHAQYVLAKEIYERVIMLTEDEWLTREEGVAAPRRNMVFRQILNEYSNQVSRLISKNSTGDNGINTEEEAASRDATLEDEGSDIDMMALHEEALLENARFDVGKARELWSALSAKRQGRAFKKGKNHDDTRDRYHNSVQKLGIMELESQISDDDDDTTKNAKVIAWLFDEQAKLRELTTEKLQGTPVGRFVNFMNKGSRKARFMKAMGLGVTAGVGGAFLAGAAGAAAIAVGAAGASRFVRGYVRGDGHRGMKSAQEEFIDSNNPVELDNESDSLAKRFNDATRVYNRSFEDDTQLEQNKRKKALAFGVGAVALGSAAGWGIHQGIEYFADRNLTVKDWIFDGNDHPSKSIPGKEDVNSPEPGTEPDTDGEIESNKTLTALEHPFSVESGHGLTHELQDAAATSGHELTGAEAWRLHMYLTDNVGEYIVASDGSPGMYSMGSSLYEVGIAAPGEYTWTPDAQAAMADYFENRDPLPSGDTGIDTTPDASDIPDASDGVGSESEVDEAEVPTEAESEIGSEVELGAEPDAPVEAELPVLSDLEQQVVESYAVNTFNDGNLSQLNAFYDSYPAAQLDDLGATLEGYNFSDGSPIAEYDAISGNYELNDRPEGATIPSDALLAVRDHFRSVGYGDLADRVYAAIR